MKRPQTYAIAISIVLLVLLFYKGMHTSEADLSKKETSAIPKVSAELLTDESFFENSLKDLSPTLAEQLKSFNTNINGARNSNQKIDFLNKAGLLCDSASLFALTGYFAEKMAQIKQTPAAWLFVANRYANALQFANASAERLYLINKGKASARTTLQMDATNLDAQNLLAQCIIEQSDDSIMTVIPILKNIESKDSNNIAAIYNLAMLSVKSGQTEKAIMRFNKLIKLEPMNPENYFRLADLLSTGGDKKQALQMLETCKSLLKSPEQLKVVDEKIKEITNK
jgi:tetratricopeptide (TPR) repeat protein